MNSSPSGAVPHPEKPRPETPQPETPQPEQPEAPQGETPASARTGEPAASEPIDAVAALLAAAGVRARPLREVLAQLTEGAHTLDDLVRTPAVPRRIVEELLTAAGSDIDVENGTYRLVPAVLHRYRARFALDALTGTPDGPEVLDRVREFVASGPAPAAALDHVTATPETTLRRAEWLRDHYDLRGARILCLGDHDLTSLAVGLIEPSAQVTVVDLDERVLAHIDGLTAEHGLRIHTLHADLRFGLPPAAKGAADVVFTDPPYTPEGVGLFAASATECLADANSRVLIAYGFSDRSPALGHKVQQELLQLGMVFEAILPNFHRYYGAQAIGSASDLYVCLPTTRTRKLAGGKSASIYTHGPQSVEAATATPTEAFLRKLGDLTRTPVEKLRRPGWDRPVPAPRDCPVFDLRADPGPWLLRMLLACNADRVAFVVGNRHPDITSEHAQTSLASLIAAKYTLRFHRSSPDPNCAVVFATPPAREPGIAGHLLHRAHGKVGNIWREALIAEADRAGSTLTKKEANQRVAALIQDTTDLGARLVDLPRHRLAALLHTADV
ncbi:bis-aminopropyl spermidine synthase family protein [Haloactinomyces albus]|uniref:N(4)-bis(aminopropyl)spermidine synthase C-terminal domain-containing protein n=1 Tax=Haloactinomyces albus TaxID=1352928 RepID=A0AAE4CMS7_9ACTN|nr:bis-aminopropyl spermidine synthase family protein [Haloactinomyces albus]MDR7301257.1 hypothetical protein [Haloactinomyces albus]